jgi:hypothetical protein
MGMIDVNFKEHETCVKIKWINPDDENYLKLSNVKAALDLFFENNFVVEYIDEHMSLSPEE